LMGNAVHGEGVEPDFFFHGGKAVVEKPLARELLHSIRL
jgi:hypothetical protein